MASHTDIDRRKRDERVRKETQKGMGWKRDEKRDIKRGQRD